jgi:hypothetical protein
MKNFNRVLRSVLKDGISFCITVKNRSKITYSGKYLYNLPNCIDSIIKVARKTDTPIEIVISDWNSTDWPIEEWLPEKKNACPLLKCKVIKIHKGLFNLAYGRNVSAKHAFYNSLFFLDADMLLSQEVFDDAVLHTLKDGTLFFPQCYCSSGKRNRPFKGWGNLSIPSETYFDLGGYIGDECWGGEDRAFFAKAKRSGESIIVKPYRSFKHQWHPRFMGWSNEQEKLKETENWNRRRSLLNAKRKKQKPLREKKMRRKLLRNKRKQRKS